MFSLILSTLEMMGITFVIGFFVAGVIKGIAYWADSLEFHHSQDDELVQYTKLFKIRAKLGAMLGLKANPENTTKEEDEREAFRQGINTDLLEEKTDEYYHGVSRGSSSLNLMDYYYPKDTRIMFLKKQEKLKRKQQQNQPSQTAEEQQNDNI